MHKDFNELTKRLAEIAEDELNLAKKKFPMFHSRHEGWGVLTEELWEHTNEIEMLNDYAKKIQFSIYHDGDSEELKEFAKNAYSHAIRATAEMIQVAAMFQKLIQSESEITQVKLGVWLNGEETFDDSTYICSVCNQPWTLMVGEPKDNNMNYCPNCGSKMIDSEVK